MQRDSEFSPQTASNLVDEIKKLSRQDQASIIVEVLDTLDEAGDEFDDEELLRELQRREAERMGPDPREEIPLVCFPPFPLCLLRKHDAWPLRETSVPHHCL